MHPSLLRLYAAFSVAILFFGDLNAQVPGPGNPIVPAYELETLILPKLDNETLRREELAQRRTGRPPKFAEAIPVDIGPETHGRWDQSGDRSIWRFRLRSPGAYSLNLGFSEYQMPAGGELYIYDPYQKKTTGPFTPADNETHNQLWTPIFPGDELVIEVQLPSRQREELQLKLAFVNHDFLDFLALNSGSCNLDIVCGSEDGWELVEPFRDVSRSVGLISIEGTLLCTGFLVNNTYKDCTPYFMTAYHCEIRSDNDQTVVVYWNFENSTCRQPNSLASGGEGDGNLNTFNSGSIYRAGWNNSDFCLLELDDPVNEKANAYFAGWSAETTLPEGNVACVHHPFTDEKRISISEEPTHFGFWGSGNPAEGGNHLIVPDWTVGTTQGGSSGAPLFNNKSQVVGQLHGGDAACGNDLFDAFGRFYNSWEGGGTANSRLKDWLDPAGWETQSLPGMDQSRCGYWVRGVFSRGTICAGDSDTLKIQYGPAYDTASVGGQAFSIPNILNIQATYIPDNIRREETFIWYTSESTPPGEYTFDVYTAYDTNYFKLTVFDQFPATPVLLTPTNGASGKALQVPVSWSDEGDGQNYILQLAADAGFDQLISEQVIYGDTTKVLSDLKAGTTYYWRVKTSNVCGESDWSSAFSFSTAEVECFSQSAADGPINIPVTASSITSSIEIENTGTLASIEIIDLDIEHSWVGDLSVVLRSPSGKEVALLDRPGFPDNLYGCDGRNLYLSFNQNSGSSYLILENLCSSIPPAISGTFKPIQSLFDFTGEQIQGTWTLIVKDNADEDGGTLKGWNLNICSSPEKEPLLNKVSDAYLTCQEEPLEIDVAVNEAFTGDEVQLSIDGLPAGSSVHYSANPAVPGDTIRLTLSGLSVTGQQSLTLNGTDGSETASLSLDIEVRNVPEIVSLLTPLDESILTGQSIDFDWNDLTNINFYRLEIATDSNFDNLIHSETVSTSQYTLSMPEQEGELFWRVIALNECGESISAISSFTFTTTATSVLEDEQSVQVFPNPFSDQLNIRFTRALEYPVAIRLSDIQGRLLLRDQLSIGATDRVLYLDHLPSGIYILEILYGQQRIVERIAK